MYDCRQEAWACCRLQGSSLEGEGRRKTALAVAFKAALNSPSAGLSPSPADGKQSWLSLSTRLTGPGRQEQPAALSLLWAHSPWPGAWPLREGGGPLWNGPPPPAITRCRRREGQPHPALPSVCARRLSLLPLRQQQNTTSPSPESYRHRGHGVNSAACYLNDRPRNEGQWRLYAELRASRNLCRLPQWSLSGTQERIRRPSR